MRILEEKQLERKIFRNLRDKSLLSDRKKVENNVKKFVNSIYNEDKEDIYIAIYWPLKNEVDIRSLKKNFALALPRCGENRMLSYYAWDNEQFSRDAEGILSPSNSNKLSFKQINLIFIPCLSVDKNLIRLGYGGGYFDRLRADKNWKEIPCIGLLTSNCLSKNLLTRANWDIPLSGIITEKEIRV